MSDIRRLLEREAAHVHPSGDAYENTMRRAGRRERNRRLASGGVAVLVATAGLLVLALGTFIGDAPHPAGSSSSGYRFTNISVRPTIIDGDPDWAQMKFDVTWDGDFPGVRLCTFRVLDEHGALVGVERQPWVFLGRAPGLTGNAVPVDGTAMEAEIRCSEERLDDPRIADLEPPDMGRLPWSEQLARLDARVHRWAREHRILDMSERELEANLLALRRAMRPELGWVEVQELGMRLLEICTQLPPQHEFRGGEFCE